MRWTLRFDRSRASVLLTILLVITGTMRSGVVLAAPCTSSGHNVTISTDCEFVPGSYTFTGTLTINNGVTVTAGDSSSPGQVTITAEDIDIQGTISADGLGYAAQTGTGKGANSYIQGSPGGGYGGDGGNTHSNTYAGGTAYGSAKEPVDVGSGAGRDTYWSQNGGAGGGAIKLVTSSTGTLTLTGTITADGATLGSRAGGGSGGSVWLDVGTLAGGGTITADGGEAGATNGGGGGGGRISINYTTDSSTIISGAKYQAYGGGRGPSDDHAGGAGTVFIDDKDDADTNGALIVDNNNHAEIGSSSETTQSDTTLSFDDVTIKNGTKYVLPNSKTLTIASGGTLTGGGSTQPSVTIDSGGEFDLPSATFTIKDLDVTNNGTVDVVTDLTLNNSTFDHNGALSATVTNLSFSSGSSGSTFIDDGTGLSDDNMVISATSTYILEKTTTFDITSLTIENTGTFESRRIETATSTTVTINSGGTLTHTANTSTHAYGLDIVATTFNLDSGGSIDIDGKGYSSQNGTGKGTNGYVNGSAGGGYGGDGGDAHSNSVAGGTAYGSVKEPTDLGSGGGRDTYWNSNGGSGGGALKLTVSGTLTLAGTITSDGVTGGSRAGGGSGGSVWLDVGTLSGAGTITADGGDAGASNGGGGGGGRISINYTTDSSTVISGGNYQAYGGGRGPSDEDAGGAGTVFIDDKDDADTNGALIVDNNNHAEIDVSSETTQGDTTATFDDVTIKGGAKYVLGTGKTLTIASGGSLTGGGTTQPIITIASGAEFDLPSATFTIQDLDVTNNGTVDVVTDLTLNNSTFDHNGTLSATTTNLTFASGSSGATFIDDGTGLSDDAMVIANSGTYVLEKTSTFDITSLTIENTGTFESRRTETATSTTVTINSGGTLTHTANTSSFAYGLDIVATTFNLNSGGSIDIDGKGYSDQNGTGKGTNGYVNGSAGGGYGGDGGDANNNSVAGGTAYGSVKEPADIGSAGGRDTYWNSAGGSGGGALKLTVSGTLTLAGTITSDGVTGGSRSGGGSGGSVWLDVGTFAGAGTITADGGDAGASDGGGGGGGRISINYTTDSSTVISGGNYQAYGGGRGPSDADAGGAGTVFIDDKDDADVNGALIVDNNNHAEIDVSSVTTQSDTTLTFDDVTIKNGAKYSLGSGKTLTIASGGTLTGGGSTQPTITVDSGGEFDLPSATFTIQDLDVTNNGTVDVVTDLTLNNSTFDHNGSLADTVTNLTFASGSSGATFIDHGTGLSDDNMVIANSGTYVLEKTSTFDITSLTIENTGTFESRRTETATSTTVTINSGGTMTHTANTSTFAYGLDIVATTFNLNSGGSIDIDGKGYSSQNGTGKGTNGYVNGAAGGGYGGDGGDSNNNGVAGGTAYGSVKEPSDLGSGGGRDTYWNTDGGAGGGALKLTVSGTLTLAGTITADGGTSGSRGGGGSGGAVWLDVATLAGAGTITANGSDAGTSDGGGGGGGRISINYTTDTSTVISGGNYQAYAGGRAPADADAGGAGTVFIDDKDDSDTKGTLVIDNNNHAEIDVSSETTQVDTSAEFTSLTIKGGAKYVIPSGKTLTIPTGGTLTGGGTVQNSIDIESGGTFTGLETMTINDIDIIHDGTFNTTKNLTLQDSALTSSSNSFPAGLTALTLNSGASYVSSTTATLTVSGDITVKSGATMTHTANSTSHLYSLNISATNLDIQSGGSVDVNGKGYTASTGTGEGTDNGVGGGGGAYGGAGGQGSSGAGGGSTYGSLSEPTELGSGGGNDTSGSNPEGGSGGGVIKIALTNTLTLDGSLTANGANGTGGFNPGGGGSGGSIWYDVGLAELNGTLTANGGNGDGSGSTGSGGGGGGRIAAYYIDLTGSATSTVNGGAKGGTGAATAGSAGSTYDEVGSPTVTVTAPNGGESLTGNEYQSITYTYLGSSIDHFRISLSTDSGSSFSEITSSATSGPYAWQISNTTTTTARIKVEGLSSTNVVLAEDVSNADFSITAVSSGGGAQTNPSITVGTPNGGETYAVGDTVDIFWSSDAVSSVTISYSTNGGSTFTDIVSGISNNGFYSWTVPSLGSTTTQARIKVTGGGTSDTSNSNFTITVPGEEQVDETPTGTVTVTAPNGGEIFGTAQTVPISWVATDLSTVTLRYSIDGGSTFTNIVSGISASVGSYPWIPPVLSATSTNTIVRVESGSVFDESDAVFTILPAPPSLNSISVIAPNGGETFNGGESTLVVWATTGTVGNVTVSYSLDGGLTYTDIAKDVTPSPTYRQWAVPIVSATSTQALVKVTSGSLTDISDATFSVVPSPTIDPEITENLAELGLQDPPLTILSAARGDQISFGFSEETQEELPTSLFSVKDADTGLYVVPATNTGTVDLEPVAYDDSLFGRFAIAARKLISAIGLGAHEARAQAAGGDYALSNTPFFQTATEWGSESDLTNLEDEKTYTLEVTEKSDPNAPEKKLWNAEVTTPKGRVAFDVSKEIIAVELDVIPDPDTVSTGAVLTYQFVLTNTGNVRARNVTLVDPFPAGTTYVPGSLTSDGIPQTDANDAIDVAYVTPDRREARWVWYALEIGDSHTVTVKLEATSEDGSFSNGGQVTGQGSETPVQLPPVETKVEKPAPFCGDNICQLASGENFTSCAVDCPATCGDNVCQATFGETRATCAADCTPVCGNDLCEAGLGETYSTCYADCGGTCGNNVCEASKGENASRCPADCNAVCGNDVCEASKGETYLSCLQDCPISCGNGRCESPFETISSCAEDCVYCGNGVCDPNETNASCAQDCPSVCGNARCEVGENFRTCFADCPATCGNAKCEDPAENYLSCPLDCRNPGETIEEWTIRISNFLNDNPGLQDAAEQSGIVSPEGDVTVTQERRGAAPIQPTEEALQRAAEEGGVAIGDAVVPEAAAAVLSILPESVAVSVAPAVEAVSDAGKAVGKAATATGKAIVRNEETIKETPVVDAVAKVTRALPKPVTRVTEPVLNVTKDVVVGARTNKGVQTVNRAVVTPAAVTVVTVSNVGAIGGLAGFQSFGLLLFTQASLLFTRRKRKAFGVVYNSSTKMPVDLAVVRRVDAETGKVKGTRVTDKQGRYLFLTPPGKWRVEVDAKGFSFPTGREKHEATDEKYTDVYYGEPIELAEAGAIKKAIPVDQFGDMRPHDKILTDMAKKRIKWVFALVGPSVALISYITTPYPSQVIALGAHLFLFGAFYRVSRVKLPKSWGTVRDKDGKPLKNVVVRIVEDEYNKVLESRVTDRQGRYAFLVGSNKYHLRFEKEGYEGTQSETLDLKAGEEGAIVAVDATLAPAKGGSAQGPSSPQHEEHAAPTEKKTGPMTASDLQKEFEAMHRKTEAAPETPESAPKGNPETSASSEETPIDEEKKNPPSEDGGKAQ